MIYHRKQDRSRHLLLNRTLATAVDTVQKLTDILVLHQAGLVDQGGGARAQLDIGTLEDDLVLGRFGLHDLGIAQHINGSDNLLTQEVSNFDGLASLGDLGVDRKVVVHQTHGVTEPLGNTGDHVVNVRADSSEGRQLLGQTEEQAHFQLLSTIDLVDADW